MNPAATWRLLDTPPAPGAWNMAVDEALMESVQAGDPPALRFYRWAPRCISLGRNQPAKGHFREDELARRGIDVVRRPTGGRAVLHDRELTYSVVCRDGALGTPRLAYVRINEALVAGLRALGIAATVASRVRRATIPSISPCFLDPAEGEVVLGGRKLIGSAQWRQNGVMLQHGSLLLHDDQRELPELVAGEVEPYAPPAILAEHCEPLPTWAALTAALRGGWVGMFGQGEPFAELPGPLARRARDIVPRYEDLAWRWRR